MGLGGGGLGQLYVTVNCFFLFKHEVWHTLVESKQSALSSNKLVKCKSGSIGGLVWDREQNGMYEMVVIFN